MFGNSLRLGYCLCLVGGLAVAGCGGDDEPAPFDAGTDGGRTDGMIVRPDAGQVCGNGLVEGAEQCDDANTSEDDQCNNDCTFACGDGRVNAAEVCDTAIAAGMTGACPTDCDDGMACTADSLSGLECDAQCIHGDITVFADDDGCCPPGGTSLDDSDCGAMCDNGVVESGETCDTAIAAGSAGACPVMADCDDVDFCTVDALENGGTCDAACTNTAITTPADGDGCCPPGATPSTDADCVAGCGDGTVVAPETCDTAIAHGTAGACPILADCDDGDACTRDRVANPGTCLAACRHPRITVLVDGDMCCPTGANATTDSDCTPICGNSVIEPPETCDDGNTTAGDGCSATCRSEGAAPTVFRMSDLDLRDPHAFVSVPFFGCTDITTTAPLGNPGLNQALQDAIQTDTDTPPDGILDLSFLLIFRPLNQTGPGGPMDFAMGTCTAPMAGTSCDIDPMTTPTVSNHTNMSTGMCLAPVVGTTGGYSPAVASTPAPCFVSDPEDMTIDVSGIPVRLRGAQIAATYIGNPATSMTGGMLRGFISEADADATLLPMSIALVGGDPLSSVLPGGTGNCSARDDRDMGPDGTTRGWWFYFNFPATRVTYTGT